MLLTMTNIFTNTVKSKDKKTIDVYKPPNKKFCMITKVIEKQNTIFIHREITWYDSKSNKHMRKREIQKYECDDDEENCNITEDKMLFECDNETDLDKGSCKFVDYF